MTARRRTLLVGVAILGLCAACSGGSQQESAGSTSTVSSAPASGSEHFSEAVTSDNFSSAAPTTEMLTASEASEPAPSVTNNSPTVPSVCDGGPPCYGPPSPTAPLLDVAPEASGVAASSSDPDLFFVVDDAPGTSEIVAVSASGQVRGVVAVQGMEARNAEAVVNGPCGSDPMTHCLYIADIGGNNPREAVTVFVIPEPDPASLPATVESQPLEFSYPDGAFDAEALLVDDDATLLLVTKPDDGRDDHRLYRGSASGGELSLVTTFRPAEPQHPSSSRIVGNVVTDASRVPGAVLLLTYDQALEYRAPSPEAPLTGFLSWPVRQLAIPDLWQPEGIAYRRAAGLSPCGFVVVSEKSPLGGDAAIATVSC
jgi:hypothetical protein